MTVKNNNDLSLSQWLQQNQQTGPVDQGFMVQYKDHQYGPFSKAILQHFFGELLEEENTELLVAEIIGQEVSEYKAFYDYPYFQRRRPQLVSEKVFGGGDDTFYLLENGVKKGPLNKDEILLQIEVGSLIATDPISLDGGKSWVNIYEVPELDRRRAGDHLPFSPKRSFVGESKQYVQSKIKKSNTEENETDAITGLAFLGHLKSGAIHQKRDQSMIEEDKTSSSASDELKWGALIVGSLMGILVLIVTWNSSDEGQKSKKIAKQMVIEAKKAKRPSVTSKKIEPIEPAKPKKKARRRPASISRPKPKKAFIPHSDKGFEESDTYQDAVKDENDDYDKIEELGYDDNEEPIELDPVRNKVARETLDGEYPLDEEEGRYPASEDEIFDEIEEIPEDEFFDEEEEFVE